MQILHFFNQRWLIGSEYLLFLCYLKLLLDIIVLITRTGIYLHALENISVDWPPLTQRHLGVLPSQESSGND
jgi:hypothetical protein